MLPIENLSMPREMNIVYNRDFSHTEILHDLVKLYREEERKANAWKAKTKQRSCRSSSFFVY